MTNSKTFYVYALLCQGGGYYVGVTSDLPRRIQEHFEGKGTPYTKRFRPQKMVYSETFSSREDAAAWERQLKGWRRDKKRWIFELLGHNRQANEDEERNCSST